MNGVALLSSGAGVVAISFLLAHTEANDRHRTEILLVCLSSTSIRTLTVDRHVPQHRPYILIRLRFPLLSGCSLD